MMNVLEAARQRLAALGYEMKDGDEALLSLALKRAQEDVRNECNVTKIPKGLKNAVADMAAGEFLLAKKTFAPEDIEGLDLDMAVERLQQGDSYTVFAVGKGGLTAEQRLDSLIQHLLNDGRGLFSCYRRVKW